MATSNSIAIPRRVKDITGRVVGRLTVTKYAGLNHIGKAQWLCRCACGTEKVLPSHGLCNGSTRSCGCLQPEVVGSLRRTHGMYQSPVYKVWSAMIQRCVNPNNAGYEGYGERSISVCERWKSFEAFYADMGPRPSSDHSIERIDNDAGYSPDNCRWDTRKAQARNRRTSRLLTFNGRTQCIADWADEVGMNPATLRNRIARCGWTVERALTEPVHFRHTPAGMTESVQPS